MIFLYCEPDGILVNVDDIVYVRALDESDLDQRYGQLRSGIPKEAVTEMRLRDSGRTHYLREPLADFTERIRQAMDLLEASADD